ncbi:MAG: hypothetical protein J0L72_11190 [Armatimonadetes bacterium]|nr:hypothetical protein [Armatimonadota bacterium]
MNWRLACFIGVLASTSISAHAAPPSITGPSQLPIGQSGTYTIYHNPTGTGSLPGFEYSRIWITSSNSQLYSSNWITSNSSAQGTQSWAYIPAGQRPIPVINYSGSDQYLDLNNDGWFNELDYDVFWSHLGEVWDGPPAPYPTCDFDHDGEVSISDYDLMTVATPRTVSNGDFWAQSPRTGGFNGNSWTTLQIVPPISGSFVINVEGPGGLTQFSVNLPTFSSSPFTGIPNTIRPSIRPRLQPATAGNPNPGPYNLVPEINSFIVTTRITDGNGTPAPLRLVQWRLDATHTAEGHIHNTLPVTSWLHSIDDSVMLDHIATPDSPFGHPLSTSSVVPNKKKGGDQPRIETAITDLNGYVSVKVTASEVSGTESLSIIVDGHTVRAESFMVTVEGLTELPNPSSSDNYKKIGAVAGRHTQNHYGTSECRSRIQSAANIFRALQLTDKDLNDLLDKWGAKFRFGGLSPQISRQIQKLEVNDISLPKGGLFDKDGDWCSPHGGHREGNTVDIRTIQFLASSNLAKEVPKADSAWPDNRYTKNKEASELSREINLTLALLQLKALKDAGFSVLQEANHWHARYSNAP